MSDSTTGVREQAVLLAERRQTSPALMKQIVALAGDADLRVRFQVAWTLGEIIRLNPDQEIRASASAALAKIARRDAAAPWLRIAVLSSSALTAAELLSGILGDASGDMPSAAPLVRDLAVVVGARHRPAEMRAVLNAFGSLDPSAEAIDRQFLTGLGNGLKRAGKRLTADLAASDSPAAERIERRMGEAAKLAANTAANHSERLAAVDLLASAEFASYAQTLALLVAPREPQTVQLAAVRALSGYAEPGVAEILLANYPAMTPAVRGEIIQALLARVDRIGMLLDAVEKHRVPAADIPAARRKLLVEHGNAAIRDRAARLLNETRTSGARLAEYQAALAVPANQQRGAAVFKRGCQACHRLGGQGHDVGPNLLSIRNRTPDEVLVNVLQPNREVAPNFQEYIVALDDGRTVTGIIADETANSVTLRRAEGIEETVLRQNIDEISGTGRSLMPEGFEKKITPREMADLIAFLLTSAPDK